MGTLAAESAKQLGPSELASLTEVFEGSIMDVTRTLVTNGYSRAYEREADQAAVALLRRVGYVPGEIITMLQVMERRVPAGGAGFGRTHPAPRDRIQELQAVGIVAVVSPTIPARQSRFSQALGSL